MKGLSRRQFLAASSAAALASSALRARAAQQPDVLFIAVEDFSPHRLGCYGNPLCKTPNIDRLAAEGVRFTLAHCTAAPCCPSRTSLFTGLRTETTGVYGNGDNWSKMIEPGATMTEHFMKHGYECIRVGKMYHKGNGNVRYDDTDRWTRVISENEGIESSGKRSRPLEGPGVDLADQGKRVGSPFSYGPTGRDDIDEVDGKVAEQGVRLLSEKRGPDAKPRLLALGFHAPHLPFAAPDKYFDMYSLDDIKLPPNNGADANGMPLDPKNLDEQQPHTVDQWKKAILAQYATLSFTDAQIGRVLDALAKSERGKNTIVVLWSDHGFMLGEHFEWRKGPLYDHSALVALIAKAPGVTPAGAVCTRPVESIDIYPTLFDLCGVPIPDGLEAISMKPLWADPQRPWKKGAITTSGRDNRSLCTEEWRYTEYGNGRKELFGRKNDPHELKNLADDPAQAETVAQLSKLLKGGWRACLPEGIKS